jgi:hypothetical protein
MRRVRTDPPESRSSDRAHTYRSHVAPTSSQLNTMERRFAEHTETWLARCTNRSTGA